MRLDTNHSGRRHAVKSNPNNQKMLLLMLVVGFLVQVNGNESLERAGDAEDSLESEEHAEERVQPKSSDLIVNSQGYIVEGVSHKPPPSNDERKQQMLGTSTHSSRSVEANQKYPSRGPDPSSFRQDDQDADHSIKSLSKFPMEANRHPYLARSKPEQIKASDTPTQPKSVSSAREEEDQKTRPVLLRTISSDDSGAQSPVNGFPYLNYAPEFYHSENNQPPSQKPPPRQEPPSHKHNIPMPLDHKTHYLKTVTKPRYIAFPQISRAPPPKSTDYKSYEKPSQLAYDITAPHPSKVSENSSPYSVVHKSKPTLLEQQHEIKTQPIPVQKPNPPVPDYNPANYHSEPSNSPPKYPAVDRSRPPILDHPRPPILEHPRPPILEHPRPPVLEHPHESNSKLLSNKPYQQLPDDEFKSSHYRDSNGQSSYNPSHNQEPSHSEPSLPSPYMSRPPAPEHEKPKSRPGHQKPQYQPSTYDFKPSQNTNFNHETSTSDRKPNQEHYHDTADLRPTPKNKGYPNPSLRQAKKEPVPEIIIYDQASKSLRFRTSPPFHRPEHQYNPDYEQKERETARARPPPTSYYKSESAPQPHHGSSSGTRNYHPKPTQYNRPAKTSHSSMSYESHPSEGASFVTHKRGPHRRPVIEEEDDEDDYSEFDTAGVPGIPGKDYPIIHKVPETRFSCLGKIAGFYADPDTQCQVWHICDLDGRKDSFLCSNGTIYSQESRVCDWWFNVDCSAASSRYNVNDDLYLVPRPIYSTEREPRIVTRPYYDDEVAHTTHPYRHYAEASSRRTRHGYSVDHS